MPRKPRLTARKRHSSFSKTDASNNVDSVDDRTLSIETQTDPVKVIPSSLEVCTVSMQTDSVEICATETQTDPVKVLPSSPQLYTVGVQTDAVKICTAEETVPSENLLTPLAHSLFVSVPLQYFFGMKVQSTVHLSKLLNSMKCIENWFVLLQETECSSLKLVKVSDNNVLTLEISSDMCWSISLPRTRIDCFASQFDSLCSSITCVKDLQGVLKFINQLKLCVGIADPQFAPVTAKCKGIFTDRSGKLLQYVKHASNNLVLYV